MAPYTPRFFDAPDFEGLVAIIETMIDTGGTAPVHAREAAARVDDYLASVEAPALEAIRLAIDAIDSWYMPLLLSFSFGRFRDLPVTKRRAVIEKIIHPSGLFGVIALVKAGARDAARTLKLLASVGYYSGAEAIGLVGYKPVDSRIRFADLDQTPRVYADPFLPGGTQ